MTSGLLDPANTNAGAMERLFLLETATPAYTHIYKRDDSLLAMRLMRQVIENRLRAPGRWGAPGAADETGVIAVGNQFAGFGGYPQLTAVLSANLTAILTAAANSHSGRGDAFAQGNSFYEAGYSPARRKIHRGVRGQRH